VDAPRGSVEHEGPSRAALDRLTSRAGILILRALAEAPQSPDGLLATHPDEPALEPTLRIFVRDGWVRRDGATYALTEAGRQVSWRLRGMLTLIERTLPATILAQHRFERTRP
jgi:DNA-binding HxlR family transcriptional regulator